jgi:hypothetical protein
MVSLVMYCSSPTTYGIRVSAPCPALLRSVIRFPTVVAEVGRAPSSISCLEYDELSALRKAQAWGAPMFQPYHDRYEEAIARLNALVAKELAAARNK